MNNLRAVFVLDLQDKLTAGLNKLKSIFSSLRDLGKSLGLGKLQDGASVLRDNEAAAHGLASGLRGVAGAADRAWSSLRRMGSAAAQALPKGHVDAFRGAVEGFSVIQPIRSFAGIENIARHSAITEGLSGPALEAETKRLVALFQRDALATSQSSESIAQAYQDLIQTGIKPELAEKLLPIHSRAATAYNISPEALGHAVFALSDSFKIDEGGMAGALASMAQASKEGRFKVEDFSRNLPAIGGDLAKLGMTGRGSADLAFAALETIMRNSPEPGVGATNFRDLLNYITSPTAMRSFALESHAMSDVQKQFLRQYGITGINVPKLLEDARNHHVDDFTAIMGTLQKKVGGLPPDVMSEVLGAFFHNQQARDAAVSMLQHIPEYLDMRKRLAAADPAMLERNFTDANAAPQKKLDLVTEKLTQLTRMAGSAFMPILLILNDGLTGFMSLLDGIDNTLPGVKEGVLLLAGGMLSLSAIMTAIRLIAPGFRAGIALLLAPLRFLWTASVFVVQGLAAIAGVSGGVVVTVAAIAAAIGFAAYDIIAHWERFREFFAEMGRGNFFHGLWGVARQLFTDFVDTVDGWTGGALTATFDAIGSAAQWCWDGATQFFHGFIDTVDGWTGGAITRTFNVIASAAKVGWDSAKQGFSAFTEALNGWTDSGSAFGILLRGIGEDAKWGWSEGQELFTKFRSTLDGWAGSGITATLLGVTDLASAYWNSATTEFKSYRDTLDTWTGGGITKTFKGIGDAIHDAFAPFLEAVDLIQNGAIARALAAAHNALANPGAGITPGGPPADIWDVPGAAITAPGIIGTITVEAAPGSRVVDTTSSTPGVTIRPGVDPGRTVDRP